MTRAEEVWAEVVRDQAATANDWHELGRARFHVSALAGGFTSKGFLHHCECLQKALALDPRHERARYHLCRVAIRAGDWPTALAAAERDPAMAQGWVDAISAYPDGSELLAAVQGHRGSISLDTVLVLHWWLVYRNDLVEAYELKQVLAEQILAELTPTDLAKLLRRLRALQHLGRLDECRSELRRARRWLQLDRARFEKLAADLELTAGDPDRHQSRRAGSPDDFSNLVRGRDVVVFGPVPDDVAQPEFEDLIVRTKWLPDQRLSSPDVAYYPLVTMNSRSPEIVGALDRKDLAFAVVRTEALDLGPPAILEHPRVRIAPDEYALHLEASQFGVQRALYDLIGCRPGSIRVFGADFFLSRDVAEGYHSDAADRARGGIVDSIDGYGHDLVADLRWSRTIAGAGLVNFSQAGQAALDMTDEEYLGALVSRS